MRDDLVVAEGHTVTMPLPRLAVALGEQVAAAAGVLDVGIRLPLQFRGDDEPCGLQVGGDVGRVEEARTKSTVSPNQLVR